MVKLAEYGRMAFSEIFHNKVRTILTLIGIIIGIAAVIVIIFVVQGAEQFILGEVERITPVDMMQVWARWNPSTRRPMGIMTLADLQNIESKAGDRIRALAPMLQYSQTLQYKGNEYNCRLITTTPSFQRIYEIELARGRFLSQLDYEQRTQVIVLGYETAKELFNNQDPLNQKIKIHGATFTVVGVLAEDYQSPVFPASVNNTRGFIPISTAERFYGQNYFYLLLRVKDRSEMGYMLQRVIELLNERHGLAADGESRFQAYDMSSGLEMVSILKIVLMVLLGGVASITLLVAGIGVMNIMLVIVTERTKEIGLRKALGATRGDIMTQFIIEAIILCLLGGVLGIIGGYLGSNAALKFANNFIVFKGTVPTWAVFLSIIFTSGVGLFFGIYPALKAAKMDPIKALHYE